MEWEDFISRRAAIDALNVLVKDGHAYVNGAFFETILRDEAKRVLEELPSAQPEYYDYSDIDDVWEFYAEEQDINLTDGAKQLKDAMWVGYRKGKQDAQPEIIRCKDCKHLFEDNGCPLRTWWTHTEDDFCSYAERKDE